MSQRHIKLLGTAPVPSASDTGSTTVTALLPRSSHADDSTCYLTAISNDIPLCSRSMVKSNLITWRDSDSDTRGTYDILSLCVSTLAICVWSAVHMDIPTNKTLWNVHVKRIAWLAVGLILPEMLVITALGQLVYARSVAMDGRSYLHTCTSANYNSSSVWLRCTRRIASMFGCRTITFPDNASASHRQQSAAKPLRTYPWTLTHGFYAAMGGFVIETSPGEPFLPFPATRVVLRPSGLRYLMQHAPDLVPDLSADDIADRSKAGAFTKAILCFQILAFCIGTSARLSQRLPLSLLEVTTLAHCLCALLAYGLWWRKPHDIGEPTVIRGEKARMLCALLCASSRTERYWFLSLYTWFWPSELNYLRHSDSEGSSTCSPASGIQPEMLGFSPKSDEDVQRLFEIYPTVAIAWWPHPNEFLPWYITRYHTSQHSAITTSIRRDTTRLSLAHAALSSYPLPRYDLDSKWWYHASLLAPDQGLRLSREGTTGVQCIFASIVIAAAYGLPHLLGLTQQFPTPWEKFCWKIATFTVIASPVAYFSSGWILGLVNGVELAPPRSRAAKAFNALVKTARWVTLYGHRSIPAVYAFASIFPVAESVRQVFALPDGAFTVPQWTRYLPHFA